MAFVQLQCSPWDKIYIATQYPSVKVFDKLVIKLDNVLEVAKVIDIVERTPSENELADLAEVLRIANDEDLATRDANQVEQEDALAFCHNLIKEHKLKMNVVDVRWSLNKSALVFAFVSDNRVDFRALVKDLSRHFAKSIRLQQIGVRDQARLIGDAGRCGRQLCCQNNLTKFGSVTSDLAEPQGLSARGSDRISGACGRLMCCLNYEVEGYKEMSAKMPVIGAKVTVDGRKGVVIAHHILKQTVNVKFHGENGESDYVVEVDLNRHKN